MNRLWLVAGSVLAGVVALGQVPAPANKVVFLDIGQGDSILLQSGTEQILIDGGSDGTVLQRLGEELPWFDRTIDIVIATHPDKDHIGGLVHVLERYRVGLVLLPEVSHTSQLQNAWLEHITDRVKANGGGTQYRFASAGQRLELNNLSVAILNPVRGQAFGGKTNNASVSTRVDFCESGWRAPTSPSWLRGAGGGAAPFRSSSERRRAWRDRTRNNCMSFLLTGDAEKGIEQQLVDIYGSQLDVDILKAGHHGSKTSSSQEFLDAVSPQGVIISAGRNNQYGHPHQEVLDRIKKYHVWRTDEQGSVRFTWNDQQWLASTQK